MLPPIVVVERKRRGRPPLGAGSTPSADVHFRMPAEDYDQASAIASRQRVSVTEVIRRAVKKLIEDERGGPL